MKLQITIILAIFVSMCSAGDRELLDAGEFVQVTSTSTIETTPLKETVGFEHPFVDEISIQPSAGGSPSSFVVSGRIACGSSGVPLERIPVLIGLNRVEPRLAGLTNMDGEFKFRLWIKEDHRDSEIQVPMDLSGFLYVGGRSGVIAFGPYPPRGASISHPVYRRYSLQRLIELSKTEKE